MIENIKEKVKQAYQNDKLLYPLVDEMCEEINGTETDIENLEVTDLGSGNASAGKVATADGSGNVEWQDVPNELPSHGEGDVGKVLKVGSEGVEWGSAGSTKLYCSSYNISGTNSVGSFKGQITIYTTFKRSTSNIDSMFTEWENGGYMGTASGVAIINSVAYIICGLYKPVGNKIGFNVISPDGTSTNSTTYDKGNLSYNSSVTGTVIGE